VSVEGCGPENERSLQQGKSGRSVLQHYKGEEGKGCRTPARCQRYIGGRSVLRP
jgi:hypothetical protein